MNAGRSVLQEIVDEFRAGGGSDTFKKYVKRYPHDTQLQEVYQRFLKSLESGAGRDAVEKSLTNLLKSRRTESCGGRDLALKDRRKFKKD
ncbi:MAG TPA: hypothetical protein ENN13_03610 [Candidatus Altiarchaeales archaeon]|nr:hypothetical protein [Candidatus Altiarchaeales archaeon]